jgi:hypothetical protein
VFEAAKCIAVREQPEAAIGWIALQQQAAILGSSTIDLVLAPGQDGKTIQPEGLAAAQMNADQQTALLKLIGYYTGLVNAENAAARLDEVQATLDQTYLAWYGPTSEGSAAFFRVSGPAIVIEFRRNKWVATRRTISMVSIVIPATTTELHTSNECTTSYQASLVARGAYAAEFAGIATAVLTHPADALLQAPILLLRRHRSPLSESFAWDIDRARIVALYRP